MEAKSFRKAKVPTSLLQHPSPASIQPTRLAIHVNHEDDADDSSCYAYFASGRHMYSIKISMGNSVLNYGKDTLLIPDLAEVISSSMIDQCSHRYEIQSIALAKTMSDGSCILGSVDSHGHLIVSEVDADNKDDQKLAFAVSPPDCGVGEGSWAGLSFSPSQWSRVAVARCFSKCIDLYDQDIHLRNLQTLWYPSSLTFVQSPSYQTESSILAVTEGCQLSMWDLRMKENGGCLQRVCGSAGDILYASSTSSTGNVAVAGADRTVTIYDARRWSVLSRWSNCTKYEITGLAFSAADPDHIYVLGVDYEVFCGDWCKRSKIISFRGDSNWLGFSKCPERDVLGGWCDSGSFFVAHIAPKTDFERLSLMEPISNGFL